MEKTLYTLLIIGNSGVGKTKIMLRYAEDVYNDTYVSTTKGDSKTRSIDFKNNQLNLQIWDISGKVFMEELYSASSEELNVLDALIMIYDITDRNSFLALKDWESAFNIACKKTNIIRMVMGNKIDLVDRRQVPYYEADNYAHSIGALFLEVSAKTSTNITTAMTELITFVYKSIQNTEDPVKSKEKNIEIRENETVELKY